MIKIKSFLFIMALMLSSSSYAQYDISPAFELGINSVSPNKDKNNNYLTLVKSFEELYEAYKKLDNLLLGGWRPINSSPLLARGEYIDMFNATMPAVDFDNQFIVITIRRLITEECCRLLEVKKSSFEDNILRVIFKLKDCQGAGLRRAGDRPYSPIQTWLTEYGTLQENSRGEKIFPKLEFYEEVKEGNLVNFLEWSPKDEAIIGSQGKHKPVTSTTRQDFERAKGKAIKWNEDGELELRQECQRSGRNTNCGSGYFFMHKNKVSYSFKTLSETEERDNSEKEIILYKLESGTSPNEDWNRKGIPSPKLTFIEQLALIENGITKAALKSIKCCEMADHARLITTDLKSR